jgi:sugar phosphate isomerase/epimerase
MRLGLEAGQHTLDLAVELGIEGVPISAQLLVEDGIEDTLAPLRDRGLQVCQIGAFGYNPLSTDRDAQMRQRAILEQAIPLAAQTGCPYIVICGGNYDPSGFAAGDPRNFVNAALDEVADALAPVVALAEEYNVKLSIEPYLKTAICAPARFLALYERVASDALRVNVDVTSFYDYWDLWDPQETVRVVTQQLAGHYGLVHIKEVALAEGFHIHAGLAPLGAGVTDWRDVLAQVAPHVPMDSWVILEHVQTPDEARASVALLRDAATRAGVTLT